jgi:broad specificity phosphatase PhoE/predicted kinase
MTHQRDTAPIVLAMVGLPARGKTYIARKVARYLSWLGHPTRVFNVGSYRRKLLGSHQPHEFFDFNNAAGRQALLEMATAALDDMLVWLKSGGEVAIYDATNTTRERRRMVQAQCQQHHVPIVFIESICDDPAVIEATVRETKLKSPDYDGVDPEEAAADFRRRIAHYERVYEPLSNPDNSYIKIIDVGRQVVLNRIHGYLPARLVPLLINLHLTPRPIWLTRHGESVFNEQGRLGGDSELSPRGEEYAQHLAAFVRTNLPGDASVTVWTSSLRRTLQTALPLTKKPTVWRSLDEIDAGVCDGMTYEEIETQMPEVHAARALDKFRYRYPRGESYEDLIQRLDPLIIRLERHRSPLLVIGHQAVLRALYAYLMDRPPAECPSISIPLHTVIQLTSNAYGCDEQRFSLDPMLSERRWSGPPP